ncbi:hypothetical protein Egran_01120 [Elaphomyces granulatus]|uniref:E3 ubiquitin ligase complex SCF subunit sconC n=1 Tax=Elaphomyces granulatus TaxID=519963 RepID=A0A232M416_9EURO|nr:hypothetical protein Egran_01120 [Elaphomyces granulatus]
MDSTVAFTSADGVNIAVERDYIVECSTLYMDHWHSLVVDPVGEPIQIPNVDGSVLKKVAEWCDHHRSDACDQPNAGAGDEDEGCGKTTAEWDEKFMQEVDREMLFQLILAADFLAIKPLHDLGCKTVANMIKGKSLCQAFGIENDFTPKREERIRREKIDPEIRMTQTPSILQLDVKVPPSKNSFGVRVRVLNSGGRHRRVHIYPRLGRRQRAIPIPNVDGSLNDAHHGDEDEGRGNAAKDYA